MSGDYKGYLFEVNNLHMRVRTLKDKKESYKILLNKLLTYLDSSK